MSRGYIPGINLSSAQYEAYIKTEYYFAVTSDDRRVTVDLHWEMSGRNSFFPFDLDFVKNRLEPATLLNKNILVLSAEDLLLYLCLHGAKDSWVRMESICSVAELSHGRPAPDWMRITRLANRMRCERMLFLGLFLAHDLFGAGLPKKVHKRIESDSAIPELAEKVLKNLFQEPARSTKNGIGPRFSMFHMQVRSRPSEKVRYALYLAIRPTVEEWLC